MTLTALQVKQLNNMNAAAQRAGLGTLLSIGEPAGTVYYVDGNAGLDTNGGLSWGDAFKTLTVALAASTANIAASSSGWAARNVIYVKGDALTENLVLLAPKTDVVGVGSWDSAPYAGLIGNHVPVGATCSYGTRFFNMKFSGATASGGDIWTLGSATMGLRFDSCLFSAQSTIAATGAILTAASERLSITNSKFYGRFSDSVIEIGTGSARGLLIQDNYIEGADVGIELLAGTTESSGATLENMLIKNNYVVTTGMSIKDSSGLAYIIRNNCFSGAAKGTTGFGILTGTLAKMQDNRITGSDINNAVSPAQGTL